MNSVNSALNGVSRLGETISATSRGRGGVASNGNSKVHNSTEESDMDTSEPTAITNGISNGSCMNGAGDADHSQDADMGKLYFFICHLASRCEIIKCNLCFTFVYYSKTTW